MKMTRRQLIAALAAAPPLAVCDRLHAALPAAAKPYPGVAYRDYARCLPDFLGALAARAYDARSQRVAALKTPAEVRPYSR